MSIYLPLFASLCIEYTTLLLCIVAISTTFSQEQTEPKRIKLNPRLFSFAYSQYRPYFRRNKLNPQETNKTLDSSLLHIRNVVHIFAQESWNKLQKCAAET